MGLLIYLPINERLKEKMTNGSGKGANPKFLILDMHNETIKFADELLKVPAERLNEMSEQHMDKLVNFCSITPPIFLKDDPNIILVARHFSYDILINASQDLRIPAFFIDKDDSKNFVVLDRQSVQNFQVLMDSMIPNKNAVSQSIRRRKQAKLLCPFCEFLLIGPKHHKPIEEENIYRGYFLISCYSKNYSKTPCGFRAYLSKEEYQLFQKAEYPTDTWLQKTDKYCPKCRKPLFLRKRFALEMLFCEDYFKKSGACKYCLKLGKSNA